MYFMNNNIVRKKQNNPKQETSYHRGKNYFDKCKL